MYVPKELGFFLERYRAVGRRTWYQKSPTYIPKEPHTYTKRALHICQRSPPYIQKDPYSKKALHMYVSKEIFFCFWKERHRAVGRGLGTSKELYVCTKTVRHTCQKSPTNMPKEFDSLKETYRAISGGLWCITRALYMYQKSPTYMPKEPYKYAKRVSVEDFDT